MSKKTLSASTSQFRRNGNGSVPSETSSILAGIPSLSVAALGGSLASHAQGRRELKLSVGSMQVQVLEIRSDELTGEEWQTIQRARDSYASMWSAENGSIGEVEEDLFDGRGLQRVPYTVWHYLATVTSAGEEDKIITMRKVYYPLRSYGEKEEMDPEEVLNWVEEHLPYDISFWEMVNHRTNAIRSLWEELRARQSQRVFDFCAISRSGIIPYSVATRDEKTREKSGIAFAAIQLLAATADTGEFMFAQQCEEFPKKALRLVDRQGQDVVLDFSPAAQTLGLTAEWTLRLNRAHPHVIHLLANFPGYWVENALAAATVTRLVQEGRIPKEHIQRAWERLRLDALMQEEVMSKLRKDVQNDLDIRSASDLPGAIENEAERIIALLMRPRYCKYLVPVEEDSALYHALVYESGDGPYPAALRPEAWEKSAHHLLRKAQEKYARVSL
ncbi:MAG: hypothetical protein NVSMB27_17700 [Ktedonobacteraceae bacterium]